MRKLLPLLVVFLLVLPSHGQDYRDQYIASCQELDARFEVDDNCEWYADCIFSSRDDCFASLNIALLRECWTARLALCEERTMLYAIAIDDTGYNFSGTVPALRSAVSAFDVEDYESAARYIEIELNKPNYFPFYPHYLALGVIHSVIGNHDIAQENFSQSILTQFYNPWAFYYRGRSYEAVGDTEHGIRDYYTYNALATPLVKATLPLSNFRYRLPDIEHWIAYPILSRSRGPCCTIFEDLTLQRSFAVQIARLDNDRTVAVANLVSDTESITPPILFLERTDSNLIHYTIAMPRQDILGSYDSGGNQLDIIVFPNYIVYMETLSCCEGSFTAGGILLPVGELDPRIGAAEKRSCPGLPISHIQIGDTFVASDFFGFTDLRVSPSSNGDTLFDNPLLAREGTRDMEFIVQQGPVCADDSVWWYVSSNKVEGWMRESLGTTYNMIPTDVWDEWVWYWDNWKEGV
jgi:tetratricopeptide (TPR) repeat protein